MMTAVYIFSCAIALTSPKHADQRPFDEKIPGTLVSFKLLPAHGGEFKGTEIKRLWLGETQVGEEPSNLDGVARLWDNSDDVSHAPKTQEPHALDPYAVLGNKAEWTIDKDGKPLVGGGSWRDKKPAVRITARMYQIPNWNENDLQNPKSKWWLANAPFVGFRVVCEG